MKKTIMGVFVLVFGLIVSQEVAWAASPIPELTSSGVQVNLTIDALKRIDGGREVGKN